MDWILFGIFILISDIVLISHGDNKGSDFYFKVISLLSFDQECRQSLPSKSMVEFKTEKNS